MGVLYMLLFTRLFLLSITLNTSFFVEKTSALENPFMYTQAVSEEDLIDTTIYDDLPCNNLAIDLGDETKADNINFYSKNGDYYLFLPKGYDRNNLRLHFADKVNVSVSLYDNDNNRLQIIKNNSFTDSFKNDKVIIKTDINSKRVHTYIVHVMQSDIPSVNINLENGDTDLRAVNGSSNHSVERSGYALVMDSDDNKLYVEVESFKGRGNRTWGRGKKPYQIKFAKKQDIYGMGLAKTYNVITNSFDGPLSRNYTFLTLAKELELQYAVDVQPIELYINNNYKGSYLLTEKVQVKKNRIETGENDFLFEIENHPSGSDYVRTNRGEVITIKNPDFDDLSSSERQRVRRDALSYLNKIENIIYGNCDDEELSKYIDYESFAKFYWVQELSINYDAMRGSNYFYVKDGKLYAGPAWDLDNTQNRSWNYGKTRGYYILDDGVLNGRIGGSWYRGLAKRKGFSQAIDDVYYQYQDVINDLPNKIKEYGKFLKSSAMMNYTVYSYTYNTYAITYRPPIRENTSYEKGIEIFARNTSEKVNYYKGQYNDILYRDLKYSYKDSKGNSHDESINDNKIVIPSDVNTITIYGNNGSHEYSKEYSIDEDKLSFTLTHNTNSNYKRANNINYTFDIERRG